MTAVPAVRRYHLQNCSHWMCWMRLYTLSKQKQYRICEPKLQQQLTTERMHAFPDLLPTSEGCLFEVQLLPA
jgi:hypothetical protein